MKFFVTGASGFIGSFLIPELECRGNSVVVSTKKSLDLSATDFSLGLLTDCDVVIHLAARVHVKKEKSSNPLDEYLKVNLQGTINLAKAAHKAGVKRIVYVSSIGVNGNATEPNEVFDQKSPVAPHNDYAQSKYESEKFLVDFSKETGIEVVILRLPLVYGATKKGNFYQLVKLIKKRVPLPLAGFRNKRSFIYVGNLVDLLIVCATHPNATGKTYLVSEGEDVSTAEFIQKIAYAMNQTCFIFHFPKRLLYLAAKFIGVLPEIETLTASLLIDSNQVRQDLAWAPPFTMDQGLEETMRKFKAL